jgi:selenide,water dikinase
LKAGVASQETVDKVTRYMATLNDRASELMQEVGVHACTDITGFGLIGHSVQLARNSHVGINYNISAIPIFHEADEFAKRGLSPGGLHRNREFYSASATISDEASTSLQDVLYDPQTSGGLLIFIAPDKAELLLGKLHGAGIEDAAIIGEVIAKPEGMLTIRR